MTATGETTTKSKMKLTKPTKSKKAIPAQTAGDVVSRDISKLGDDAAATATATAEDATSNPHPQSRHRPRLVRAAQIDRNNKRE